MAVRRVGRGPSTIVYVLILFVFLFLTTLGLSILFYSQLDEVRKTASEAETELETFAKSREQSDPEFDRIRSEAREADRSVFKHMQTQQEAIVRQITGSGQDSPEQVRRALQELGIQDTVVTEAVGQIRSKLKTANDQVTQLQDQLRARQEELQTLEQQYQQAQADRQQRVQELNARIDQLKSDYNAYQGDVDTQRDELAKRLEEAQNRAASEIRQRENEIKRLENELTKRDLRIKEILQQLKQETPEVPDGTDSVDGKIVAVNRDENLVYVNLGQRDHLVLGMTFEVFDAERGVQIDQNGDLRGKASIEIVDMGDQTATARIARESYSRPVLANDVIANLVYDKNRTYKFYVFGDFDLDGDGKSTLADHDQVVNLIEQWGGKVVDPRDRQRRLTALLGKEAASKNTLPLDTDFVIVGEEPELPQPVPPGTRDPQVIKAAIQAKQKWDAYMQLRNEADSLSVPLMSQNRFLSLIGYYQRQL